jgi:hypothetical protein
LAIADVLSRLDDRRVQQALAGEAAAAEGAERMPLVRALTHSAKLFGNQLEDQQVARFVAAAQAEGLSDEDATAYAALLGALGVRNNQIVPLILGAKAG